jgi:cytochrome c1
MIPRRPSRTIGISAAATALSVLVAGCGSQPGPPKRPTIGDAHRGAVVITRSGCGSCHEIPGIQHAVGLVGPPLDHFSRRTIIAGLLPNTAPNLVRWIRFPQAVVPGNAMPNGGLTDAQARDVAAYLYGLR